ncbi:MAG: DUF2164 domain-containing protein [Roseibium sp.]|nr:DUF2164 domain-containing protein [Roseibium sp.]
MASHLSYKERAVLAEGVRKYLADELDVEIGNMDAEFLIEYLSGTLGSFYYNQGLRDAEAVLSRKLDDVSDELRALERPAG